MVVVVVYTVLYISDDQQSSRMTLKRRGALNSHIKKQIRPSVRSSPYIHLFIHTRSTKTYNKATLDDKTMPKTAKARKKPITKPTQSTGTIKAGRSSIATQATISRYHVLLKRQAQLKAQLEGSAPSTSTTAQTTAQQLAQVEEEMQALGGLEAYQSASILGQDEQRGGDTSKVLVKWLKELDVRPKDRVPLRSVLVFPACPLHSLI